MCAIGEDVQLLSVDGTEPNRQGEQAQNSGQGARNLSTRSR